MTTATADPYTGTEDLPDRAPAAEAPTGRVGWRRVLLILIIAGGAVMVLTHGIGGRNAAYVGAGAAVLILVLLWLWRYPHLMRHFHPFGLRDRNRSYRRSISRTGFRSPGFRRNRSGLRAPFRAGGRRGGGLGLRSLGSARPRRGLAGLGRPRAGSGRKSGSFTGFRRGSGAFRRSRRASGGPGGPRRGSARRAGAGAGILRGRRRSRPGAGTGGSPRARAGRRGAGRRPAAGPSPRPRRWLTPWRGRGKARTDPKTGKSRPKTGKSRPETRWARAWRRVRRSRAGRATRRTWRTRPVRAVRGGARKMWSPAASRWRRWRAAAPARKMARLAHRARMRGWKAKLRRVNPKPRRWYAPWRARFAPVWRVRGRRLGLRARITRRWRIRRGKHTGLGLVRRPAGVRLRAFRRLLNPRRAWVKWRMRRRRRLRVPQPWAPRGTSYQRQLARFDQWRRARFRRRFLRHRARTGQAPAAAPQARPATPPPPRQVRLAAAPAVPLPSRIARPAPSGSTGGSSMASAQQAADAIGDIGVDWDTADELDEVLKNVGDVIRALYEKVRRIGEDLEPTALRESYGEAVKEAAGSLNGVADQLHDVVGGGVLRR